MLDTLARLKRLVARVTCQIDGKVSTGTAFLVGTNHVLTCAHVIGTKDHRAEQVTLHFSRGPEEVPARVLGTPNFDLDIAVLALDGVAIDISELLPLGDGPAPAGDPWHAFGHPKPVGADGLVLSGTVEDADARAKGQPVLQLAATGARDEFRGASGSPVLIRGNIAGMLSQQLMGHGTYREVVPVFGMVYAVRTDALRAYLASTGVALPASVIPSEEAAAETAPTPSRLVILHSEQRDRMLLDELERHLSLLHRQGIVDVMHRAHLQAGTPVEEYDRLLDKADVVLIFVTPCLMHEDYDRLAAAVARRRADGTRVVPILVRPYDLDGSELSKLVPLPRNGIPVTRWGPNEWDRDAAWTDVVRGIRSLLEHRDAC